MAAEFTTLTEQTARDLIDLLRRDRSNPRGGPAMVGNFVPQGPLVTRWAKTTTTPDYPTYPSSGNVVGVKFGEYEPSPIYPGATATKTFTAYDPAWYEFATLENGSMPAVDTIVRCTWRDGRWWILQESTGGSPTVFLLGGSSYNSDGSSRNLIKGYGDGYSSDDRMGYVFFDFQYGDASGVGLSIVTSDDDVSSTSSAETSALFSLSTTGLYIMRLTLSATDQTTIPAATSSNVTSSTDSGHNHTVARLTDVQYQSNMAATLQSRVGAGAWGSVSGWTGTTMYSRTGCEILYRYELYHATMLVANSTAGKEYRVRLSTAIYPQTTLADPADHAERAITGSAVQLAITYVDDDPTLTAL